MARAKRPALPDVIVLGDSHSNALAEGCAAHGLDVEMIRFSGNFWHQRRVVLHPDHGVWIANPKGLQQQVLDLNARLGGKSLLEAGVPIIGSFGFHLGRFVPVFTVEGHVTTAAEFAANPEAQFVSQAYVEQYVIGMRAYHIRLARRIERMAPLVMVAPPFAQDEPNMRTFFDAILTRMRTFGLTVHDPNSELPQAGPVLDPAYLLDDRTHGNTRYGTEVIGQMLAKGLLAARA